MYSANSSGVQERKDFSRMLTGATPKTGEPDSSRMIGLRMLGSIVPLLLLPIPLVGPPVSGENTAMGEKYSWRVLSIPVDV